MYRVVGARDRQLVQTNPRVLQWAMAGVSAGGTRAENASHPIVKTRRRVWCVVYVHVHVPPQKNPRWRVASSEDHPSPREELPV